jgi:hypothetical protein
MVVSVVIPFLVAAMEKASLLQPHGFGINEMQGGEVNAK